MGKMNIIYDVTRSFYQLYNAIGQVEIDQARLTNSEEAYRVTQLKYQAGRISVGEVLQLEVVTARSCTNLVASEIYQRVKIFLKYHVNYFQQSQKNINLNDFKIYRRIYSLRAYLSVLILLLLHRP